MPQITRKYPGKTTAEIYRRVDTIMEGMAERLSLRYQKDEQHHSGSVSKMGVSGCYTVKDDEVVVDLKFPMFVPDSMRRQVTDDIQKKLDGLFE